MSQISWCKYLKNNLVEGEIFNAPFRILTTFIWGFYYIKMTGEFLMVVQINTYTGT